MDFSIDTSFENKCVDIVKEKILALSEDWKEEYFCLDRESGVIFVEDLI